MVQQMILMPSTLSHGNHARYYSRNQVHTMTWRWPCATACSCSKDSYRSRDMGGRKERVWTTHSSRGYYARRLRAEGATTVVLRLINYHCHSFTFAIRRVHMPNIVPYKASWFANHLCVNGPAVTPLLQRHTSSVTERGGGGGREREREKWEKGSLKEEKEGERKEKTERRDRIECIIAILLNFSFNSSGISIIWR